MKKLICTGLPEDKIQGCGRIRVDGDCAHCGPKHSVEFCDHWSHHDRFKNPKCEICGFVFATTSQLKDVSPFGFMGLNRKKRREAMNEP